MPVEPPPQSLEGNAFRDSMNCLLTLDPKSRLRGKAMVPSLWHLDLKSWESGRAE